MKINNIEIKGSLVFINGKLIKPRIYKLKQLSFAYPERIEDDSIGYLEFLIKEEGDFLYQIIIIPPKKIGGIYNKFPARKYYKESYFQLLGGEGKIQNFYEDVNGRAFCTIENFEKGKVYKIKSNTFISISNTSFERLTIIAKTPKEYEFGEDVFYIGETLEQNPNYFIFGKTIIEKEEGNLLREILENTSE